MEAVLRCALEDGGDQCEGPKRRNQRGGGRRMGLYRESMLVQYNQ